MGCGTRGKDLELQTIYIVLSIPPKFKKKPERCSLPPRAASPVQYMCSIRFFLLLSGPMDDHETKVDFSDI